MSDQSETSADWKTQFLRLSLFPLKSWNGEPGAWRDIVGKEPERVERQPRTATTIESGEFENGLLVVTTTPLRLDIIYSGLPHHMEAEGPPSVGQLEPALDLLSLTVGAWLGKLDLPVVRIALGGILMQRARDRESAYETLAKYVASLKIDPREMRDLLYRVNWRVMDPGIGSLQYLNRLTTWSVQRFVVGSLAIPGVDTRLSESDFVQLEFDHNTPADNRDPIDRRQLQAILNLLAVLAVENASSGERP